MPFFVSIPLSMKGLNAIALDHKRGGGPDLVMVGGGKDDVLARLVELEKGVAEAIKVAGG